MNNIKSTWTSKDIKNQPTLTTKITCIIPYLPLSRIKVSLKEFGDALGKNFNLDNFSEY